MEIEYTQTISPYTHWTCPDCGALVGNQAQHTLWHNDLVKAFEEVLKLVGG
jgi:hypothetical protein